MRLRSAERLSDLARLSIGALLSGPFTSCSTVTERVQASEPYLLTSDLKVASTASRVTRSCEVHQVPTGIEVRVSKTRWCSAEEVEVWAMDSTTIRELEPDMRPHTAILAVVGGVLGAVAAAMSDSQWDRHFNTADSDPDARPLPREVGIATGFVTAGIALGIVAIDSARAADTSERKTNERRRPVSMAKCGFEPSSAETVLVDVQGATARLTTGASGRGLLKWDQLPKPLDLQERVILSVDLANAECEGLRSIDITDSPAVKRWIADSGEGDQIAGPPDPLQTRDQTLGRTDPHCDAAIAGMRAVGMTVFRGSPPAELLGRHSGSFLAEAMRPHHHDPLEAAPGPRGRLYSTYGFELVGESDPTVCVTDASDDSLCSKVKGVMGAGHCITTCGVFESTACGLAETRVISSCVNPDSGDLEWLEEGTLVARQRVTCTEDLPLRPVGFRSVFRSLGPLSRLDGP